LSSLTAASAASSVALVKDLDHFLIAQSISIGFRSGELGGQPGRMFMYGPMASIVGVDGVRHHDEIRLDTDADAA
jgi:hypothetical protein